MLEDTELAESQNATRVAIPVPVTGFVRAD
jgi:hypothetical protein